MDPANQQTPPGNTPAPVPTVGGAAVPPQASLSQDEMKNNLKDMMAKIDSKYQDFNSQKFASSNKAKEQQSQLLRSVFDLFQAKGIDPSNVQQVGAFLNKIKTTNPEMAKQLETTLLSILGEEVEAAASPQGDQGAQAPDAVTPPDNSQTDMGSNNMNTNADETVQQNV